MKMQRYCISQRWKGSVRGTLPLLLPTFISFWIVRACPAALGDATLTLQLPPSKAALQAKAEAERAALARQQAERRAAAHKTQTSTPSGRLLPSRGWSHGRYVVGGLGVIVQPSGIYRLYTCHSAQLSRVVPGTDVAIVDSRGGWLGILMSDYSTGWIPADRVKIIPDYQVTSDAPVQPRSNALLGSYPDIYPHTNTPFFQGNAQELLAIAYSYLGVPYVWGGESREGLDCSGFVQKVFGKLGYHLPRTAAEQMAIGIPVPVDQLQPGDRLYFEPSSTPPYVRHTGIYIGNGYFIHSSVSGHGVAINRLDEGMWPRIFVCARR